MPSKVGHQQQGNRELACRECKGTRKMPSEKQRGETWEEISEVQINKEWYAERLEVERGEKKE